MTSRPFGAAVAALTAALAAVLTGCGTGTPAATEGGDGPLTVFTSTDVYGAVARAVGGDLITVDALIDDPAADPHSYEATPADAAAVARAAVVVTNGGGYDDFVGGLVESAGTNPTVIDVVALSGLEQQAAGGDFNEHVWYSLPTVQKLADRLATDLGTADPAHRDTYTANAATFSGQVDGLITDARAIATAHPGARVAVTEPVPGYLLQEAGLTDVTPPAFTEAIEEDSDPPAAAVAATLALFGADPVAALVINAQTSTPTTDQVRAAAQTGGVPVVEVTETLPEGATDYPSWMGAQIDALAAALNGN